MFLRATKLHETANVIYSRRQYTHFRLYGGSARAPQLSLYEKLILAKSEIKGCHESSNSLVCPKTRCLVGWGFWWTFLFACSQSQVGWGQKPSNELCTTTATWRSPIDSVVTNRSTPT